MRELREIIRCEREDYWNTILKEIGESIKSNNIIGIVTTRERFKCIINELKYPKTVCKIENNDKKVKYIFDDKTECVVKYMYDEYSIRGNRCNELFIIDCPMCHKNFQTKLEMLIPCLKANGDGYSKMKNIYLCEIENMTTLEDDLEKYIEKEINYDNYKKELINRFVKRQNIELSMLQELKINNKPFIYNLWIGALNYIDSNKSHMKNPKGAYMRWVNSMNQYKNLTWNDSVFNIDIDDLKDNELNKSGMIDNEIEKLLNVLMTTEFRVDKSITRESIIRMIKEMYLIKKMENNK